MKKLYFLFTVLGLTTMSKAQLTQSNHAPVAGDTYTLYHCDSTGVSTGASGTGVTWNYSSVITLTSSSFNYSTSVPTNTAYPNANIAVASKPTDAIYLKPSATGVDFYGGPIVVSAVSGQITYSTPALVMTYPCNMGASASKTISGNISIITPLSGTGTYTGNSTVNADATGTLVFSNRTYTDVLRVVSSQTLNYTISGLPGTINYKIYEWYTPGIKQPIFSINTATVATMLGTSTQSYVARHKTTLTASSTPTPTDTGIHDYQADNSLEVFPNPASNVLNITINSPEGQVNFYDVMGKMVLSENITMQQNSISTLNLPDGVYVCELVTTNKIRKTQKVVIQH